VPRNRRLFRTGRCGHARRLRQRLLARHRNREHLHFGDAACYGAPGPQSSPLTSAVRTADGNGYWILFANGTVATYGDAAFMGAIPGQTGGHNPATAIFATADGGGYWISSALGAIYSFGDAPYQGGMSDKQLKAPIVAATGW
jgi:hypothetical protein